MRRAAWALAVVLLLLPACAGPSGNQGSASSSTSASVGPPASHPPSPSSRPPPPPANASAPGRMDLVGCTYTALALRGDGPKAAARLPPGYGLRSEDSAVSDVNLDFLECPSIVAGNQSVLGATTIAFVLAQVEVPKEVEREGASHGYLFEAFSDSDAWIAAAAAWGLPVRKAALASSVTQASSAWTVTVDGATWYSTQDAGGAGPAEDELVRRLHYADPSGGEAWLDVDGHWEFAAVNRPVAVQAAAGVLRDLAPGGQGALAGVGSPGPYSGTMTPGRPS